MIAGLGEIYERLASFYGPQNWWPIVSSGVSLYLPEYKTRERTAEEVLEIWIGAILTQNTAWKNVEKALALLKSRLPLTPESLLACPVEELATLIRCAGYYTQKAKKIRISMEYIKHHLDNTPLALKNLSLPEARRALLSLWGIGPETADSILLYGLRFPVFVIDAYTRRILLHLGYEDAHAPYERLQGFFHDQIPADAHLYGEYHALLVAVGKICSRKPQCSMCPLRPWCQKAQ